MTSPYLEKCKRLRTDGPTPCLCCPGECVGDRPEYASHEGFYPFQLYDDWEQTPLWLMLWGYRSFRRKVWHRDGYDWEYSA